MMDIDPAKEKQLEEMPNQNFDIKIMGQTIASGMPPHLKTPFS